MRKLVSILTLAVLVMTGCMDVDAKLSEEEAKSIVLNHAGVVGGDVTFERIEKDRDNGKVVYEIEFHTKDMVEYDYEIDANTGSIIKWESEPVYD